MAPKWRKDDTGKPKYSLLPVNALALVAKVMEHGAAKYGTYNWESAPSPAPYVDAALRHLFHQSRHDDPVLDADSSLPALAHAAASTLIALELCLRRHPGSTDEIAHQEAMRQASTEALMAIWQKAQHDGKRTIHVDYPAPCRHEPEEE